MFLRLNKQAIEPVWNDANVTRFNRFGY